MKRIYNITGIFCLVTLNLFGSCKSGETDEVRDSFILQVSPKSYDFPSTGGEKVFTVEAQKITTTSVDGIVKDRVTTDVPYTISISGDGFSVTNNTVKATSNPLTTKREASMTIKITGATQETSVKLSQEGRELQSVVPLPGGKKNFSVVTGRLTLTGENWAQIANIEFNPETGEFEEEYWYWDTVLRKGKTAFSSYYGTIPGLGGEPASGTIYLFTPKGWIYPVGESQIYKGTFSYNESTGKLEMYYQGGKQVTWSVNVLNGYGGLAELVFSSASSDITHGRGYGSNADWSVFKKLAEIPRVKYIGQSVLARRAPDDYRNWFSSELNLGDFSFSENGGALRYQQLSGSFEFDERGIVYHFSSNNDSRSMIQNHFVGSLAGDAFPTYNRNLHPYAVQQIINDAGDLVGFLQVEQQNPPEAMYDGNWQYQIRYSLIEK